MVKSPVDTYDKMMQFIQTQLRTKKFVANYQPVMIKLLLEKGNQPKQQITQELWIQNNKEREQSHYLSVPVYIVLVDNGVVTKIGNPSVMSFYLHFSCIFRFIIFGMLFIPLFFSWQILH